MKIGIYAPYRHCEQTAAAIRLCNLALQNSFSVSFMSSDKIQKGIYSDWDSKILSWKPANVASWARGCTHIVWFENSVNRLLDARDINRNFKSTAVVSASRLNVNNFEQLAAHSTLVFPAQKPYLFLRESYFSSIAESIHYLPWDGGFPSIKKADGWRLDNSKVSVKRVYVHADLLTIVGNAQMLGRLLEDWLGYSNSLHIVLDCEKKFSKKVQRDIDWLADTFAPRFDVRYKVDDTTREAWLRTSDLVWLPQLSCDFANLAARAVSCGTPVIGYNLSPLNELIVPDKTGCLINGDVYTNWSGSEAAITTIPTTLEVLQNALDASFNPTENDINALDERTTQFENFWLSQWS